MRGEKIRKLKMENEYLDPFNNPLLKKDIHRDKKNRIRAFTIRLLCKRWEMKKEGVKEILHKYRIPGHIKHLTGSTPPADLSDIAFYFEEYILAVEKEERIKPRKIDSINLT